MNRIVRSNLLGTVHNIRKEAKKHVDELPCMLERFGLCGERSVQSLTLSASQLRLIAENGELQRLYVNPVSATEEGSLRPGRIGVKAASAFAGFCQQHDKELFVPIDEKLFEPSANNLRLLFFRALAQEITKKASNVLFFDSFFWADHKLRSTGETELTSTRVLLGLRDNFYDFDRIWPIADTNENGIQYVCFDLACAPNFASVGILNPEAYPAYFPNNDPYDGRVFRGALFAALPTPFGIRIAFAWFNGSNGLVKPMLDRFRLARGNLLEFCFQFCLEHCECTFFKPSTWTSLTNDTKERIIDLMRLNMDGLPYDLFRRPLREAGLGFEYKFRRIYTNSTWVRMHYGRSKVT